MSWTHLMREAVTLTPLLFLKGLAGVAVMAALYALEFRYYKTHGKRNLLAERAKERGHVVTGTRLSMREDTHYGSHDIDAWYRATYQYEVNGKTYKYRYRGKAMPTMQMPIYYLNSPRLAFSPLAGSGARWIDVVLTLGPIAAGALTVALLGGV